MNYKSLFLDEYQTLQLPFCAGIEQLAEQCRGLITHEWIEEIDMIFYKTHAFTMSIDDILMRMPMLDWYKIAYETIKRRTGACCHLSAAMAGILSYRGISNSIAIGSCLLTKGKYAGLRGIHYWNRVVLANEVVNIDLCSSSSLFIFDEQELKSHNIICNKEVVLKF